MLAPAEGLRDSLPEGRKFGALRPALGLFGLTELLGCVVVRGWPKKDGVAERVLGAAARGGALVLG